MNALTFTLQRIISLLDLTSLNDDDNDKKIMSLCHQAHSIAGNTAAVCIYPHFIPIARQTLNVQGSTSIRIATVVNFPYGNNKLNIVMKEIHSAISDGANEIDMVFPYQALIDGNEKIGFTMVKEASDFCQNKHVLLKVIIESGALKRKTLICHATDIAIAGGAHFIKTSTGKLPVNATLKSAEIILNTIIKQNSAEQVGFKVSGGIRTIQEATAYLSLFSDIMGQSRINARHFRIGTSTLLNTLLGKLSQGYP